MYTSSPKSLVSEHLSSDLSDDTVHKKKRFL
jgi:hypothetical protein